MFIEEMPAYLAPYIEANEPVQVASSPGAGKSETLEQIAYANSERDGFEWGYCTVFAAALSPVDFYGFLTPGVRHWHDFEGKERITKVSEFTEPPFMLSMDGRPMNSFKRGIVVFEEWDKAEADTKKATAQPIMNGSNGVHKLHKGISRVVLVNRAEDRSGTTKNFDYIINRRGELTAYASMPGWVKWAAKNNVDPMFVSYAERHPTTIFTNKVPEVQGPFPTPRSFVKCQNVIVQRRDEAREVIVDDVAGEIMTGWLGDSLTASMMAWLRMKTETPSWDDIVAGPDKVEIPERADACLMSAHEVAHRVDKNTIRPAIRYVRRLPKEFAMSFGRAAIQRLPILIANRDMMEWSKENRSLLNILGGA